ncbi:MAG: carbohydrate kinase [Thermoanaerobaculales bacterium]|jgi:fructokinase|nr:carbohydrate kinase [Thermoanaerobaculales bacterium]
MTEPTTGDDISPGSRLGLSGRRPVVIGEVLFDVFPDGAKVLGGAPLNVAWHLHALGLEPLLLSRIGDDELGGAVLDSLDSWGMDCSGLQIDPDAPTGRVAVDLEDGSPTFDIVADQAYDRFDGKAARDALVGCRPALLYHGSLIARDDPADRALQSLRGKTGAPIFVDVNLRDPWWSVKTVTSLIRGARWVKLNDHELGLLSDQKPAADAAGPELAAAELARRHGIDELVVTRGDQGAFVWIGGRFVAGRPPGEIEVIDTVGAGDAFSAVWIAGLLRRWDPKTTLARALDFAAVICGVRGATTEDRRIYDHCRNAWRLT